jgi:hypothetical protein
MRILRGIVIGVIFGGLPTFYVIAAFGARLRPPDLPLHAWVGFIPILLFTAAFVLASVRTVQYPSIWWIWLPAIAGYMFLIILSFANIFAELGLNVGGQQPTKDPLTCLYFSAITFTTVGYGDIHPSESARFVAAIEAVFGYLFLGVAVGIIATVIGNSRART